MAHLCIALRTQSMLRHHRARLHFAASRPFWLVWLEKGSCEKLPPFSAEPSFCISVLAVRQPNGDRDQTVRTPFKQRAKTPLPYQLNPSAFNPSQPIADWSTLVNHLSGDTQLFLYRENRPSFCCLCGMQSSAGATQQTPERLNVRDIGARSRPLLNPSLGV